MNENTYFDLVIRLAHHTGLLMEMFAEHEELTTVWDDVIHDLREADQVISARGLAVPSPIAHILERADETLRRL